MESVVRVKKSLRTPIRKLTSCVSEVKEKKRCTKRRNKRCRGGRGECNRLRKTLAPRHAHAKDPLFNWTYLCFIRKPREAMNSQKNAARAAMRDHFRRKYRLSENAKDTNHLKSAGGNVLSKLIHPDIKTKDDGYNLLSAFQGLTFGTEVLTRRKLSKTPMSTRARGHSCNIMTPLIYSVNASLNQSYCVESRICLQPLLCSTNLILAQSVRNCRQCHGCDGDSEGYGAGDGGAIRTLTVLHEMRRHMLFVGLAVRSMSVQAMVSVSAQVICSPIHVLGGTSQRTFCVIAAKKVLNGNEEGTRLKTRGVSGQVRNFEEIPHTGRSGWLNLVKFWREDRFRLLHKHMESTFNALGPIYREHLGTQSTVNIMLPSDISELFHAEGLHPQRMTVQPWATHREIRQHRKGVFLKNGEEWRADRLLLNKEVMKTTAVKRFLPLLDEVARDFCRILQYRVEKEGRGDEGRRTLTINPSPDLFRFALEASCHVLYGERIGLFSSTRSMESEKFIWAVERMLATTQPLLYLPHRLLLRIHAPLWTQHATAWDHIFSHAEARIQKSYQRLSSSQNRVGEVGAEGHRYTGVLGQLMEKGQLSLDLIKANITELMAGSVDTTAVPLQFALFELGRNPEVQERVRNQVRMSWAQAGGDAQKALQGAPLLKGTIKEILRLYPVGITVQRYPVRDIVLQNYHVPAGTLVQACLYPMGRSPLVFKDPLCFDPDRWSQGREEGEKERVGGGTGAGAGFRSLVFGFGARQCVGRRIAENEMQLLLMHILLNFQLSVPSSADLSTTYTLILQPETPPKITFTKITHLP
ncbi:cytochrome P450 11B, mitochondrial [Thalassophryne amazonica]|uniref:cytochrome P450 11B, mitochondrial n=1 Tax=Thalassophryne amazonica TaxID=390379 RepID=UPI001470CD66|nr:cytochrome P450 11B, mitochondrial [Thalassophryne amazonica]